MPFHRLAHGGAAEHQALHAEEPRIGRKLDAQPASTAQRSNRMVSCGSHSAARTLATAIRVVTLEAALSGNAR